MSKRVIYHFDGSCEETIYSFCEVLVKLVIDGEIKFTVQKNSRSGNVNIDVIAVIEGIHDYIVQFSPDQWLTVK